MRTWTQCGPSPRVELLVALLHCHFLERHTQLLRDGRGISASESSRLPSACANFPFTYRMMAEQRIDMLSRWGRTRSSSFRLWDPTWQVSLLSIVSFRSDGSREVATREVHTFICDGD